MKSIDFRCRPPYKSLANDWYYGEEVLKSCTKRGEGAVSESAWKRDMDLFLKEMDENEVVKGVVHARVAFGPMFGKKVDNAYVSNEDVSDLVKEYPDRFIGVASVDLLDTESAFADIDKFIINGNLSGLVIEPGYLEPARAFDDKLFYPIYQKCEKEHIFVLFGSGGVYKDIKTSRAVAIENVAQAFPDLTIIVGHAGWPDVMSSIFVAETNPNVYLSPDNFLIKRPGSTDYLMALNGELNRKMLFGTAYPFFSFEFSLNWIKEHVPDQEALANYLYNNGAKVLGLE